MMSELTKTMHVCPYRIVIDTREQAPWRFTGLKTRASAGGLPVLVETVTGTLPSGDYSIEGLDCVAIERKSKVDLYGTLGRGRERFARELDRLQSMVTLGGCVCVIVEADWLSLQVAPKQSRVPYSAIEGSILAMQQDYPGVPWLLTTDRRHAEWLAWKWLDRQWNRIKKNCDSTCARS